MVQINFAQKSVTVKIVYYGPGMSGKTTNLEVVHQRAPQGSRGDLTSISTDGDRTLFFDFMPLDLGTVAGMKTQFQIYTVPGQVYYNSTRKLVLQGVDGVIFVADSSASMMDENLESLHNLGENLAEYGKDLATMPMVVQYNKRDLPDALPVSELERALNPTGRPSFEAVANTGQGVFPTLKALAALVLDSIHQQTGSGGRSAPAASAGPGTSTGSAEVSAPAPATGQTSMPAPAPAAPAAVPTMGAPSPVGGGAIPLDAPAPAAAAQAGSPPAGAVPPIPNPAATPAQGLAQTGVHPQMAGGPAQVNLSQPQEGGQVPAMGQVGGTPPTQAQPNPVAPQPGQVMNPSGVQGVPGAPAMQQPANLAQTGVHPQVQMGAAPEGPAGTPAPGLRMAAAPMATTATETVQPLQAAPVGQPAPASLMQVPAGTQADPPPATSRTLPTAAPPRIKPRQAAVATPTQAADRKSTMITAAFVLVALAAGVAIGGLTFGLF